jgi:subtilisin family serine protease
MPNQTCSHTSSSRFTKRSRWMRNSAFALACSFGSLLLWSDASSSDTTRENSEFNQVTGSSVKQAQYVPGEVIVKFHDSASQATVAAAHALAGGQTIKSFTAGVDRFHHLKLGKGENVEDALAKLRQSPAVEYAEPNYLRQVSAIPNDTQFTSLWGLRNTGQNVGGTVGTADVDIDAPEAWDITTGSSNVIIGVIDTGIAYDHPDLAANIWKNPGEIPNDGIDNDGNGWVDDVFGYDFFSGDSDPMDLFGHGTHVAGTIGAVGNNNSGVTGVMQRVKLMALKAGGAGNLLTTDAIAQAFTYAISNGARVINASFTGLPCSKTEHAALSLANTKGVMVLAAAGNDDSDSDKIPVFPAGYSVDNSPDCGPALPNVISVAAINQKGAKASFSNYGASSVQIAAPGAIINSTKPGTPSAANDYQFLSGTSQATPHVTGVVGLLLSVNPNLTVAQIRNAILNTGDVSPLLNGKVWVSSGRRLNAFNALNSIAPTFAVMVAKNGTGTGTVASAPAGIDCGGDCNERFPGGSTVTLTATPSAGSVFTGWSGGGCSGTGTCAVSTTATVTASFNLPAPAPFTVTVKKTGAGTVTSNPAGINCGGDCTGTYPGGTTMTLTAAADAGSVFTGWNGGGCAGAGTCVVSTSATVTATFTVTPQPITVTVNKNGTGGGTVTSNLGGIDCGGDCIGTYPGGTTVTLTPRATVGSRFAGWSGGCSGTTTCQVTSTVSVTATFNVLPPPGTFTVTILKGGDGTGKVASASTGIDCGTICSANFLNNTTVTLTATADSGSTFTGWSGNGCTGTGPCDVNTAASVTATFDAPAVPSNPSTPSAGGGGCTIAQAGTNDALMPIMLLMTIGALVWRSRRRL